MTDELSIQQQRPSAAPYFLTGAALGTGAGFLVNKYGTKASTPEELIAEANAKDIAEFSEKQKPSIETLKGKLAELKKAEDELKVISEGTSPEIESARKDLEKAKNELQKEIERLQNIENKAAGVKTAAHTGFVNPKELTGTRDVLNEYTARYDAYQKALEKAETTVDRSKVKNIETEIDKRLENIYKQSKTKMAKINVAKEVKEIEKLAEHEFPEVTATADTGRVHAYMKEHGIKSEGKAVKEINASIKEQRKAMVEEILGEKQVVDVVDSKGKVTGKRTTYAKVEQLHKAKISRTNGYKNLDNDPIAKSLGLRHDSPELKDIKKIHSEIAALKKKEGTMIPKDYAAEMKKLEQKLSLAQKLERINASYTNSVQRIMNSVSRVQTLKQKVENAVHQNTQKEFGKLQRFVNKHPELNATIKNEANEETSRVAKQITEADVAQSFRDKVEAAEKKVTEAVHKGGTVDTAKKAAKEAEVATMKKGVNEYASSVVKDFKSPFLKQKWIAPVACAVLLGACALGLRPDNKA